MIKTNRRRKSAPKYRKHKSGAARVVVDGKTYWLGKFGTDESQAKYSDIIAEHWNPTGKLKPTPAAPVATKVTISKLAIKYAERVVRKHGEDSAEWKQVQNVLRLLRATYGHLPASEFGPSRFENFRDSLIDRGLSRQVIKRKANYVLKMFQRGVALELIPVELWQRLLSVGPVEMDEKPRRKRGAVKLEIVKATQKQLTPILADMVEVHRLIGARPSEVCKMRPHDIDRSKEVWKYTPASHKTEHHGHSRAISIGPKAQAVLMPYLLRDSMSFCFTPSEAFEQHCLGRSNNRTTPLNEGNKPGTRKPRTFQPNYNKDTYRRAIQRAVLRAFPIPDDADAEQVKAWKDKYDWTPNQLRKSAATQARKECDLETAQSVLGHSSKKTTERYYAGVDDTRGEEFAKRFG